ncbi:MAG: beta-lactamase family protein [Geodermatophilaceae bacterium]|nr:beta-lactamase family protein [Geodermatophilaceae bacterium]
MSELKVEIDPAEVGLDSSRLDRLEGYLQGYVDAGRLPGYLVAVTRRGQLGYLASGGYRHVEDQLPVETDTLFRIYSMTKPITSVAAMMLFEAGGFELNDPISRFLPAFADTRVFVAGSDLKPVTVPAGEPIRVRHLLTHTSGLTYGFHRSTAVDAMYRAAGYEWSTPPGLDSAAVCDQWASFPLLFQPGSEWNYGVSTDVLGRLVEVLSGQSLAVFFAERICGPLEMTDTSFGLDHPTDRLSRLYLALPDGMTPGDELGTAVPRPDFQSGGGGLLSTCHDYHRFTQMLLGGGELDGVRLLSPRTVAFMTRNHLPGGADLESYGRPLYAETPLRGVGFGLGFSVVLDPVRYGTLASVGDYGWGGAASTAFWVDPAEELTCLFFTQLLPSSALPIRTSLRQLVNSALVD